MPKRREPKAFVSSTYVDLKKHRAHVIRALRKSGIHVDPMEDWTADDAEPKQFSQKRVEGCDLCILLVAFRRGYVPDGETLSITQMEYEYTRQHGINVLVFLLDEEAPWPRKFDELDKDPEIGKWREQLGKDHGVGTFGLDEQTLDVLPSVLRWKHEQTTNTKDPEPIALELGLDLEKYSQALLIKHGRVHLDNVDVTGAYYDGVKLWDVFVPQAVRECHEYYPQVLEIPKEHQQRLRDQGEGAEEELHEELMEDRRRTYFNQPLRDVLELGQDTRLERVVVLGDPGSGKSALLRYLALSWARQGAIEQRALPIPILIELRDYDHWPCGKGKSFQRYLSEAQTWFPIESEVVDGLAKRQGQVVLLLDGLDEIFDPAHRKRVLDEIQRFALDYPQTRIVVTSRVIGYTPQALQDANFRHFMLQDLEEDQMRSFLDRWHIQTFDDDVDRERKQARLAKAVAESRSIRELGGNPLLLTMMAILNRHQELPRYRAELYQQASKLLLHQWDTSRFRKSHTEPDDGFDYHDKATMLQQVADFMQANREGLRGNIISSQDLHRHLADYLREKLGFEVQQARGYARSLVEQLRERNFVLCYLGAESYGFVHRTFLEYFCASAIVYRFKEEQSLSIDELIETIFGQHWHEEAWHEVLCLICGMIDARFVGQILEYLLAQEDTDFTFSHIFLAARCYGDARNPGSLQAERVKLREALFPLLEFDYPFDYEDWKEPELVGKRDKIYQESVRSLVQFRVLDNVRRWLAARATSPGHYAVRCSMVHELAQGFQGDPNTVPTLKHLVNVDPSPRVQCTAVQELVRGFKENPDTLPWLNELIDSEGNYLVRRVAVQEFSRCYGSTPDALGTLKRLASTDAHAKVRCTAVQELVRGFKDDADTLAWLKHCATSDGNHSVRQTAVQELARNFKDDADTLPWLKRRATSDKHYIVRHAAVEGLARGFLDDPDTLLLLKQLVDSDDNYVVRCVAVEELARGIKDDPETLPGLLRLAIYEDNHAVRQTAIQELVRGFKDYPATFRVLKILTDSSNYVVRCAAVQGLARGFPDVPETFAILEERAKSDDYFAVRCVAVEELARGFHDVPETITILKERAKSDDHSAVCQAAVQGLARNFKHHPEVQEFLASLRK